ncbi:MAG: MFS transporter, partial [Catalinimonas sp.]
APPSDAPVDAGQVEMGRRAVLRDPRFYLLLPAYVFVAFFFTGIVIHHHLLADAKGWTMGQLAAGFVGYGVVRVATFFLAGPLIDRLSARRVFVFHLLPLLLSLGVLALFRAPWAVGLYLGLMAVSASTVGLTGVAMWAELYGTRHFGSIKSMVATIGVLASALGPLVVGAFLEGPFGLRGLLTTAAAAVVVVTFLAWLAMRHTTTTTAA